MKRAIEKGNLAFYHMVNICDMCKRCKGFRKDKDDSYDCKYNNDNKGLVSGPVRNHMENYKCKYFKRHSNYYTCALQSKNYSTTKNKITKKTVYIRGKFCTSLV